MTPRPDPGSAGSPLAVLRDFVPPADFVGPESMMFDRIKAGNDALAAVERLVEAARDEVAEHHGNCGCGLCFAIDPFEEQS